MNQRAETIATTGKAIVREAQDQQITFLAASLAYYAFISLIPLLLLTLALGSLFGGEAFSEAIVGALSGMLSSDGEALIAAALTGAAGRGGATIIGIGFLLWSGLKIFRALDIAFSSVYDSALPDSIVAQVKNGLVTLIAVAGGLMLTAAVGAAIAFTGLPVLQLVGPFALVIVLAVAFVPLYYFLPAGDVSLREALPGAVFAAVGWTVLQTGFRIYAGQAEQFQAYGIIGAVLLLVTLFYLGSIVLLAGAVINAVLAGRTGAPKDRQLHKGGPRRDKRQPASMTDERDDTKTAPESVSDELAALRADLEAFEEEIEQRTVTRDEVESDLERYVRGRMRRGHARGWGPYLVLLYGTVMTLGAFFYLSGGWAILAMLVVWLSTLGLYVVMLGVGLVGNAVNVPGRVRDRYSAWRQDR
ncbi:YihY/virulence factor BrkB family protein [Haladaptatus sp. ZSTT2]|uniref:YihY/virulence factor BrkB family protein n=1 Tax=Haladaptatus sp. ZSTT2 TaxID=3120515 RepID=UPI00300F75D2